ncbi:Protein CBG03982 [Caenorhabditis briggsae]|uniref:Protein CBG03982 n=1 Tax=Caenorhabditis briggsae TaxID=6238 RepID=A8WVW8_CAEBR|nr:Protein CBG03982 [Caenorhabditis briggsae]CAP24781.2 Protein CBG03982 [Caenorhabditis briggsae]
MLTTSRFPRSASAYENTATSFDDEFDDEIPGFSEDTGVKKAEDVEKETLEVNIPRDQDQPNGMAFRMVGSRSRGIFIDYVHSDSPQFGYNSAQNYPNVQNFVFWEQEIFSIIHSLSSVLKNEKIMKKFCSQNTKFCIYVSKLLREGDKLLRCNKISLRAVSADQAASIFRFWMNRTDSLTLTVERRADGENVMLRRRRQARLSMCNEQREQTRHVVSGRATVRLTSSKSAEVFRCNDEAHVGVSSFRQRFPKYESFDTSPSKTICPHCNAQTRLLYLHQFSHGVVNNAFRFLTVSRSSYSLL